MKFKVGALAAILVFTSAAHAAEIFVREARGSLTRRQVAEVTGLVKNAIRNMSEHSLVRSASEADYTLQPSVIQRGDEMVLRVEKQKNGEIIAMSEETINSVNASASRAMAVTETALSDVNYGRAYATNDDEANQGTMSAQSMSAQDSDAGGAIEVSNSRNTREETAAAPRASGADATVGELTSASPRMLDPNRIGQVQLGVGPSFGINMESDTLMYDLMVAYAVDFNENFVGKVFGDFNIATGSSQTRFIDLGVAGEYYPTRELLTFGKPYLGANLGYAFTRDGSGDTGDGLATGASAGFKFQAAQLNWDVAANYTILLEQVADNTPQVFGIRVALGF